MGVNTVLKYTKENKIISNIYSVLEIIRKTLILLLIWTATNSLIIGHMILNQPAERVNIPPANMEVEIPPILEVEMPE